MKQSEIKEGKMYSDGKTARVLLRMFWDEVSYVTSRGNFTWEKRCTPAAFARWAKFECTVVLELE